MIFSQSDIERHQRNESRLKSLQNGRSVEIENKEVFQFLEFVRMSFPNLSFTVLKSKNQGFTELKK